jgi:parallel beta-helix repeat protein
MSGNGYPRVSTAWRWVIVSAVACLPAGWTPHAAGRAVACGDTIVADVRLESDLVCAGSGLLVGADGIQVNLNGHAITGADGGIGIDLAGRAGVSVIGGRVAGFFTGIRTLDASDIQIKGNRLEGNNDGVDLQIGSRLIAVKDNAFVNNAARGIMVRSGTSDNEIKANTLTGNNIGILLFGTVGTAVKQNALRENHLNGIRLGVLARDNLIAENAIASHPAGIELVAGAAGSSTGNRLLENVLSMNGCGLKGPLAGNTVKETTFHDNAVDVCGT